MINNAWTRLCDELFPFGFGAGKLDYSDGLMIPRFHPQFTFQKFKHPDGRPRNQS
jgi:hypothetical protein